MPETTVEEFLRKKALELAILRAIREVTEKYRSEIQVRTKEILPAVAQELLDEAERGTKLS